MKGLKYYFFGCFILIFSAAFSQKKEGLRIHAVEEGIYIYHSKVILNGGFNIYRDGEKLNSEPILPITYPEELQEVLGEEYDELAGFLQATSPQNLYLKLISNRVLNQLSSFLYPSVAKALGKLYVDSIPLDGSNKTYKIEFTDDLGQPTGEFYEESVSLNTTPLAAPTDLKLSNKGSQVSIKWMYPKPEKGEDDKVIQFYVFKRTPTGDIKLNENIIIRNSATQKHNFEFNVQETGVSETYYVVALDITQKASPPSELVNYFIKDNVPPPQVSGVNALAGANRITISWNTNTVPDLAGYYVYRSKRMREGYQKVIETPLDLLTTFFIDSTAREGQGYSYKVSAVDKSGNESPLSLASKAIIEDNTSPDPITNLTTSFENNRVIIKWEPIDNSQHYRSYIVSRKQLGDGTTAFTRLNSEDLREALWTDLGKTNKGFLEGARYEYSVQVVDSAQNFSEPTFARLQIPDLTPPQAPESLQAINENGAWVNLRWNGSQSADTEHYKVYRQSNKEPILLTRLSSAIRNYRDTSAVKGNSYVYLVTAIDSLNNESEPVYSDTLAVKDFDPPRSVRNVRVSLVDQLISWEPVVAFDLAGYHIYEADIPTGDFQKINGGVVTETSFPTTRIQSGKWYRIRSVDISGNESKPSEPKQAK
ncbi:MAG: hypothetical protein AAF843_11385 [Bacteroidota bacterium]